MGQLRPLSVNKVLILYTQEWLVKFDGKHQYADLHIVNIAEKSFQWLAKKCYFFIKSIRGTIVILKLSFQVWDPGDKDKTVLRQSYLYYGDPYTG